MIFRLSFANGHLEVIGGAIPVDLLRTCRELAAEYPEGKGVVVLGEVRGEPPSVAFHGEFPAQFQQRLRNLWALKVRGQKLPERLGEPSPAFQVAVSDGTVRPVLGSPPDVVMKFCQAFARGNPAAVVRVTGLLEVDNVSLQVIGDMPELVQGRLRRRWDQHQKAGSPSALRPNKPNARWNGKRIGGAIGAAAVLGVVLAGGPNGRINTTAPGRDSVPFGVTQPFSLADRFTEEPPLGNGEVIEQRGPAGPHAFYVDNRDPRGFVVRLISRAGAVRRAFYVGPSQRAQVQEIPDGVYDVVFIQGRDFSRTTGQFQSALAVWRLDELFEYRTEHIPGGTRFWTQGVVTSTPQGRIKRYPVATEWARK